MKTKNGVYYNLYETEYKVKLSDITFYFSSNFYKHKFCDLCFNEITRYLKRFDKILTFDLDPDRTVVPNTIARVILLSVYQKTEKRGFLISYKDNYFTHPSDAFYLL